MIATATDPVKPCFRKRKLLQALVLLYAIVWVVCAIRPVYPSDWLLENLLVFLALPLITWIVVKRPLSDVSYLCITVFLISHAIGAHYTYAEVPFGFTLQELFSLERNHFDRLVHFGFGFLLAYPIREIFQRHSQLGSRMSGYISFATIAAASAVYEVIEMIAAMIVSPETAIAYLGVQGDLFDAQKDTALAIGGGLLMIVLSQRHFARNPATP